MRWQTRQDELDVGRKTAFPLAIFDHCDDEPYVGWENAISVEQYGIDKYLTGTQRRDPRANNCRPSLTIASIGYTDL